MWNYWGLRALLDDGSGNPAALTREYHFELEDNDGQSPLLSIFGGKITTFRTLAEHALEKLRPYFSDLPASWTANEALPGGDLQGIRMEDYIAQFKKLYDWLPAALAERYVTHYGNRAVLVINGAVSIADLGQHFGAGLCEKEIDYLMKEEWAQRM